MPLADLNVCASLPVLVVYPLDDVKKIARREQPGPGVESWKEKKMVNMA